jgi:hypothetical protein
MRTGTITTIASIAERPGICTLTQNVTELSSTERFRAVIMNPEEWNRLHAGNVMAASYQEDQNIGPEHAAQSIGNSVSWAGKFLSASSRAVSIVSGALTGIPVIGKGVTWLTGASGSGASMLAGGVIAAGEGLKVVDDLAHGEGKKAGKHLISGAAMAGVALMEMGNPIGWIAETASLVFTGKFLTTNVGNLVGQVLDGADRAIPKKAHVAGVGFSAPVAQLAAPQSPQEVAPYGMSAPPGGWQAFEDRRRGVVPQQPGTQQPSVVSGNPGWGNGVLTARQAVQAGGMPIQSPA